MLWLAALDDFRNWLIREVVIEAAWTSNLSDRHTNGGAAAFVISNVLLDPLKLALQLHPKTSQVHISGNPNLGQRQRREMSLGDAEAHATALGSHLST
jgi:hypothetical protein